MTQMLDDNNWNQLKEQLKERYTSLSDDDLTWHEGQQEEVLQRLEKKTGRTRDQLREEVGLSDEHFEKERRDSESRMAWERSPERNSPPDVKSEKPGRDKKEPARKGRGQSR